MRGMNVFVICCIDFRNCCLNYGDVCGENGSGSNLDNYLEYLNYGYSDYPASGQLRTTSKVWLNL